MSKVADKPIINKLASFDNKLYISVYKINIMTARSKILKDIIGKIDKLPETKLKEILSYIEGIENLTETQEFFLSFAGSWKDLDDSLLIELTENLHERRKNDIRPIN